MAPFSEDQLAILLRDGATVRTRSGVVIVLDVPLEAVERILAHQFVVASERSSPLYPESREGGS